MKAIDLEVKRICEEKLANDAKLSELFKNCYPNTMDTTVKNPRRKRYLRHHRRYPRHVAA